ncbi:unnamed protein product [Acanthoscelides obtectus]|uniref:Uncharacterized protein n=1 Tax=Acanthoscelides obtectus TaxID=200917 RepID=A0A9P0PAF2_ACAOB|nr:unnamed protein product [Acanthoscelides obtectus]CAK1639598.1 hypothetical protein AOBTE_LOCUS11265 [Acanthoscelides obtectus]
MVLLHIFGSNRCTYTCSDFYSSESWNTPNFFG